VHCLHWPPALGADGGYGRCIKVELLHKLHDECSYASLHLLREGIERDLVDARAWLQSH
jgi:riboflavin kinase/FMN adenylyltransferase